MDVALLPPGRAEPDDAEDSDNKRCRAWLHRGYVALAGTPLQRGMLAYSLGSGITFGQDASHPPAQPQDADNSSLLIIGHVATVLSDALMCASCIYFLYAVHPMRLLLSAGYNGGRTMKARSWWEKHFGTDLLFAGQLNLAAIAVFILAGVLQVLIADAGAWDQDGFMGLLSTSQTILGWENIVAGVLGSWAMYVFNRMTYPGRLTQPVSTLAKYLEYPSMEKCFGYTRLGWIKVHLLNDNLVSGWLMAVAGVFAVLGSIGEDALTMSSSVLTLLGGLAFLEFAYKEGTMLDPVLFGCYRAARSTAHPMGELFAAPADDGVRADEALDAAVAAMRQEWTAHRDGVWLCEREDIVAVRVRFDVQLHVFALSSLLRSEEFHSMDPAAESVTVVQRFGEVEVLYVQSCASPPMPRSDRLFAVASRETEEGLVVAHWAVTHASRPEQERVTRDFPFLCAQMVPTGPRSSQVEICIVVSAAAWMPKVLLREELDKAALDLLDLQKLPRSSSGQQLIAGIEREVWKAVAKEMPPCSFDLFRTSTQDLVALEVTADEQAPLQPELAAPSLQALSPEARVGEVAAAALAFADHGWQRRRGSSCKPIRDEVVRVFQHQTLPGAWQATTRVAGVHPMALALLLASPDFKRQDASITELREVRQVDDMCAVWYQRSRFGPLLKQRDACFCARVLEISAQRALVVEWPVDVCPAVAGAHRMRSFSVYDVRRRSQLGASSLPDCELTLSTMMDLRGCLGNRSLLRPMVNRTSVAEMFGAMEQLSSFFLTSEGSKIREQIESKLRQEVVSGLRPGLSPQQLSFMETYSDVFAAHTGPDLLERPSV